MLQGTVNFNVPPLPDADYWFINAQAWSNYWGNISLQVTFNPAATTVYVPVPFDESTIIYNFLVDGVPYNVPSALAFASLKAQLAATDAALQDLRTQLKAAGFISNSQ